jgi:hypothetical protein
MPDGDTSVPQVPESKTVPKKETRLSLVWIVPIVAALAGASCRGRRVVQDKSFDALAAAHSRALATVSGDIAGAIRAEAARRPEP